MVENVAPTQTWEALQADEDAQLVDVRTDVEWNFVGAARPEGGWETDASDPVAGLSDDAAQRLVRGQPARTPA